MSPASSASIAVMGPEQAAGVLAIVTEKQLKRDGKPVYHATTASSILATAARCRRLCLSICREAQVQQLKPNTSA